VLHAHFIHVIAYIHGLISRDLVFCYSRWYFFCHFILPSDSLFIHSSALLILSLNFHVCILLFHLFVCTLVGPLLTDLIFQHQILRRPTSHCSKEPRETTRR